ncbi:MAG: helix-turn-helix transcriptional regulator [Oscillospiraceae bacterium]|nr:helix-turn-helix transcriptional regulator [Oscillospiraceae bacterium]
MTRPINPIFLGIGTRIAHLRRKRGLTQAKLSEQLDITDKHLSECERGLTSLSLEKMFLLCDILETDMEYLTRGNDITKHAVDLPDYIMDFLRSDNADQRKLIQDYFKMFKRIHDD